MKKLLLLVTPLALLMSSCFKNEPVEQPKPQEMFCFDHLDFQTNSQFVCDIADSYVRKYRLGLTETMQELKVEVGADEAVKLIVDFDLLDLFIFKGTMVIDVVKNTFGLDKKTVDINQLKYYHPRGYMYLYGGIITIDELEVSENEVVEQVAIADFSWSVEEAAEKLFTFSYSYDLRHTGIKTDAISDDEYTWSNGEAFGDVPGSYGKFISHMEQPFKAKGSAVYTYYFTEGNMSFYVDKIGSGISPINMSIMDRVMRVTYNDSYTEHVIYN